MNWPMLIVLAYLWARLVQQLYPDWTSNPQYGYGWFVPVLAGFLFWKRWLDRPAPAARRTNALFVAVLTGLAIVFALTRLVQEANRDWGVVSWFIVAEVTAFTLALLWLTGGGAWVRHFAFPVLFIFTAVPWPREPEHHLVQQLMQIVAALTVELLAAAGIPAIASGNLIELGTGMVGVDEACSGVRSLQSTLMASLFLGELYRFGWRTRAGFVAAGLAMAFALNVVRSFWLAWIAARSGLAALEKFHDQAGLTILLICFAILWISGEWLDRRRKKAAPEGGVHQAIAPNTVPTVSWPRWLLVAVAGWLVATEMGVETWYRSRARRLVENASWDVRWPTNRVTFEPVQLPETTRKILAYDDGGTGVWRESDGTRWTMFFFRWRPGPVSSTMLARAHRPDHCLPASGRKLVADLGVKPFEIRGLSVPFRVLVFDNGGQPLHVFFCLWEDRIAPESQFFLHGFNPSSGRIKAVWEGQRTSLGQQTLEFIVAGGRDIAETEAALRRMIGEIVVPR